MSDPRKGQGHQASSATGSLILDLLLLALAGAGMWASFPPLGFWPMMIPAIALQVFVVDRVAPLRAGIYAGASFLIFLVPTTSWLLSNPRTSFVLWLGICAVQSVFYALWGAGLSAMGTWQWARSVGGEAVGGALLWVAVEEIRSRFPLGGFTWAKVAYPQVESPLAFYAPIGGEVLVTFVVVVCAILLRRSLAIIEPAAPSAWVRLGALSAAVVIAYGPFLLRLPVTQQAGSVSVVVAQTALATIEYGTEESLGGDASSPLADDLVDAEYVEAQLGDGSVLPALVADGIEISHENLTFSAVRDGAQIIYVQTTAPEFQTSTGLAQLTQVTQFRSAELSRSSIQSVGEATIAATRPDGSLFISPQPLLEGNTLDSQIPLRTSITLATRLGDGPAEFVMVAGTLLAASSMGAYQYGNVLVKSEQKRRAQKRKPRASTR